MAWNYLTHKCIYWGLPVLLFDKKIRSQRRMYQLFLEINTRFNFFLGLLEGNWFLLQTQLLFLLSSLLSAYI